MWCWAEGKEEDKEAVSSQKVAEEETALLPAWGAHWSCSKEIMECLDQWLHKTGVASAPQREDEQM